MEAPTPGCHSPPMAPPSLLDDRSIPDFRDRYQALLSGAGEVAVALSRVRLAGLQLEAGELLSPKRIRVVVMELSGITLAMEADRLAEHPRARERVQALAGLLEAGRLQVRSAPLGGWSPDFSIFVPRETPGPAASTPLWPTLMVGPHWMERPYPHRGPALTSIHRGTDASRALARFEELWSVAHDVSSAVTGTLRSALQRGGGQGSYGGLTWP